MWISEQGPQGPVSPISQKFSFLEAADPVVPDVGDLAPQGVGLVVGGVDGGVELLLGQLPDACEQLPGPADGLPLVVVAERPVAEHLEEGVVVGVASDLLEIVVLAADAQHLLAVGGAQVGRVSAPRKTCLNGTMPALVKSRLGSLAGTSGALGRMVCPRSRKKSRKLCRMRSPVTAVS